MKKQDDKKPHIRDYLDYRKFMIDYYKFKKQCELSFSYAQWAEKAGFKSKSYLRLVMLNKRSLTAESIPQVGRALDLNKQDTEFFINLVNFNQSFNFKNREIFLERLMKTSLAKKITVIQDSYQYLTNHITPRLQVVLSLEGVEKTTSNLAKLLNAKESQVDQALSALESMGCAQFDAATQQWSSTIQSVSIPEHLGNTALQTYHKKCLNDAIDAIAMPTDIRNFHNLLIVLNEAEYKTIIKEYNSFIEALVLKYQDNLPDSRRVYQLNLNLIPVSELLKQEKKQINGVINEVFET